MTKTHLITFCVTALLLSLFCNNFCLAEEEEIPTWKLEIVPDQVVGAPNSGRRMAILLVDRSKSMGDPWGTGKDECRWDKVYSEIKKRLDDLRKTSSGIEVRIRFFSDRTDCLQSLSGILTDENSVSQLFAQFPKVKPDEGGTALYDALWNVCVQTTQENKLQPIEWLYFELFSDGKNTTFNKTSKEWQEKFKKLKEQLAAIEAQVFPVGAEADQMLKDNEFGLLVPIGDKIPTPPAPRVSYKIQNRSEQNSVVSTNILARVGQKYPVPIEINLDKVPVNDRGALLKAFEIGVETAFPFQITGSPFQMEPRKNVELSPTNEIVMKGAVAVLTLKVDQPLDAPNPAPILRGSENYKISFRPAVVPPNDEAWKVTYEPVIKINTPADFLVNLVPPSKVVWTFSDGQIINGPGFSAQFKKSGTMTAFIVAKTRDQEVTKERAVVADVVDAEFHIVGGDHQEATVGDEPEFKIEKVGGSPAQYQWFVNGADKGKGETVKIKFESVGEFNVSCTATSDKGKFEWYQSVAVKVKIAPKILLQDINIIVEGLKTYSVVVKVYELDEKVKLTCGKFEAEKKPDFGNLASKICEVVFEVPYEEISNAKNKDDNNGRWFVEILATCGAMKDSRKVPIQRSEAAPFLKEPADNAKAYLGGDTSLILGVKPIGDEKIVGSILVGVVDADGKEIYNGRNSREAGFKFELHPEVGVPVGQLIVRAAVELTFPIFKPELIKIGQLSLQVEKGNYVPNWEPKNPTAYTPVTFSMDGLLPADKVGWILTSLKPVAGQSPLTSDSVPWVVDSLSPGEWKLDSFVILANKAKEKISQKTLTLASPKVLELPTEAQPGKPITAKILKGIPLDKVKEIHWKGPGDDENDSGPSTTHATRQFVSDAWGNQAVTVEVVMLDGSKITEEGNVAVKGDSPTLDVKLDPNPVTGGTKLIKLKPGLSGDCKKISVIVQTPDGAPIGSAKDYEPSQTDIPIDVPPTIENFQVVVTAVPFPLDPSPPQPSITKIIVVPPAQWWWWIACLIGFALVAWRLFKYLFGNEPMLWTLEFGLNDPGPPTSDSGELASLAISSTVRDSEKAYPPYKGWSRRDKSAFVPLWLLHDRIGNEEAGWLKENQNPHIQFKIRNFWSDPFVNLPSFEQGWGVPEQRFPPVDSQDGRTSTTYKLLAPNPNSEYPHHIYLRARCPKGADPLLWIFWTWIVISLISLTILLPVFHMTRAFT